jgi:hypothetical protein
VLLKLAVICMLQSAIRPLYSTQTTKLERH